MSECAPFLKGDRLISLFFYVNTKDKIGGFNVYN